MSFHLVCVHPWHKYSKGQVVTDPDDIASLSVDREHHFVRVSDTVFAPPPVPPVEFTPPPLPEETGVTLVKPPPASARRAL